MFSKILIANRGEIACRVAATARRLGMSCVAVYSDADVGAKHVAMADEAVRIGPPPAAESYLCSEKIIDAARRTGAEAIHPGYGFLSENPEFADVVKAAGLAFIGPPADAIRAMGLKDAAKALMETAGVPVVPGYHGENQDPKFLASQAARIGFPLLIKARAGGGGKGMRRVDRPDEFNASLQGARREAQASFGDPACLIEKLIAKPRHVEIQIFADSHENVVHLFERDCSLQRRHQKVIEEAPAPGMPPEVREAMGRAAVTAAKTIGYEGAGTVEFIADASGPLRVDGFWFMEMNTRLQVEHPVTEAITGLDLVELQLRVAAGEPLPIRQGDIAMNGHALEARIYAEDVARGFLPATGTLSHLAFPDAVEFSHGPIRIDSGVRTGDTISLFYDPMIAKLVVHDRSREATLNRIQTALRKIQIAGLVTNVSFLSALVRDKKFVDGRFDTGLIERHLKALIEVPPPGPLAIALASVASLGLLRTDIGHDPWESLTGWRQWSDARQYASIEFGGKNFDHLVVAHGHGRYTVEGGGETITLDIHADRKGVLAVTSGGYLSRARVVLARGTLTVFIEGNAFAFSVPDQLTLEDDPNDSGDLMIAPMPGLVKVLDVEAGATVRFGEALMVLEAMKMEHTLTAPRDGIVAEVHTSQGQQVSEGAVLLTLVAEANDG